jgi:hypothetical protein
LVDKATAWIGNQEALAPDKPFDVLPGNSLVVGLSPFEENGHEAEAI